MTDLVYILFNDGSNKQHTGVIGFDRNAGGTLQIPSGSSFPSNPVLGELFWNSASGTLYRRNAANNAWVAIGGAQITASSGIEMASASIESAKLIGFDREYDNGNCGGNTTINWRNGQKQVMTLTASVTASFASGTVTPEVGNYLMRIVQGATGGPYSILWPSSSICTWAGSTQPTLTSGSGKIDICTFYYNGNRYFGVASLNFG